MRRAFIRPLLPLPGRLMPVSPKDRQAKDLFSRWRSRWLGQVSDVRSLGIYGFVLVTPQADTLIGFRTSRIWPRSYELCILHHEGRRRVWRLVAEAEEHARDRWPDERVIALLGRRARATQSKTFSRLGWTTNGYYFNHRQLWLRDR